MKFKKLIPVIPAACLLLSAAGVISAGAVDAKTVTSGAVVEVYSGSEQKSKKDFGSVASAWQDAVANANGSTETIITLGSDWTEDELLTVKENQHITLDLNGHYIRRDRKRDMIRNGEVFLVEKKAVFTLRDSDPKSKGFDGVRGGVITGGASSNTGGGVHIEENGEFRMEGGTIYSCITDEDGGGVYVAGSSMDTKFTMTGGRIYACQTVDSADECCGGGVYLHKGVVNISNAKIDSCYSEDDGGAIYSERGTVNLDTVIFAGNHCHEKGGAIYTAHDIAKYQATVVNVKNCIFANNHADEDGGAILINDNPEHDQAVVFHNCKFRGNSANEEGGAIYVNDDNVALSECEIVGNTAGKAGGGVYVDGRYNVTIRGLMIIKNNSGESAAVSNLALHNGSLGKARIINAGLYQGSEVHLGSTGSSSVLVSEWVSYYQKQYFIADKGTLTTQDSRTVNATMVTSGSIFSMNGFFAVAIVGGAGIIGAAALVVYQKKKNKAKEGGEENDQHEGS